MSRESLHSMVAAGSQLESRVLLPSAITATPSLPFRASRISLLSVRGGCKGQGKQFYSIHT